MVHYIECHNVLISKIVNSANMILTSSTHTNMVVSLRSHTEVELYYFISVKSHPLSKKREFNGISTHLLDGYISANQRFFSTFLSKITKYNQVPLGFDPSVARLLGHDPTPRPTCPVPLSKD